MQIFISLVKMRGKKHNLQISERSLNLTRFSCFDVGELLVSIQADEHQNCRIDERNTGHNETIDEASAREDDRHLQEFVCRNDRRRRDCELAISNCGGVLRLKNTLFKMEMAASAISHNKRHP